MMLSATVAN